MILDVLKKIFGQRHKCKVYKPEFLMEELERRISFDASMGDLMFHDPLPNLTDIPHASPSDHHLVLITDSVAATDGVRQAIPEDSQVIVVDSHRDNLKTINEKIAEQVQADGRKIGALAVLAHAEKGKVFLGTDKIDLANVQEFKLQLEELGTNFAAKGQIQLFGCSVAEDIYGKGLTEVISVATHTDVFASTNATGHGTDKDWTLEYSTNPATQMKTAVDAEQLAALPLDLAPGFLVVTKGTVGPLTSVTADTIINLNNAFSVTHSTSANSATLTNVTLLANPSEGVAHAWTSISVNTDTDFLTGLALGAGNVDVTVPGQIRIISVTADQATAILGTLSGTLKAGFTGNAQILIYAQDTNWDGADSTLDVLVSKPPQITVPGAQSLPANSTATISPSLDVIGPPDTAILRMTLKATQGNLSLWPAAIPSLTFLTGDGTNDATMVFTGTIANINAALNGMTYTPNANYAGTETLSITADDQSSPTTGTDTKTVPMTITNTAPVITLPSTQSTNVNTILTVTPNITITDAEAGTTSPLRVTMSVTHGTLSLWPSAIPSLTFLTGTGTGDTAMQFTGTLPNINEALKGLTYAPSTDYTGTDALSITVNDQVVPTPGTTTSNIAVTVNADAGNITIDPPTGSIFSVPVNLITHVPSLGDPISVTDTATIPDPQNNLFVVAVAVDHGKLTTMEAQQITTTTQTGTLISNQYKFVTIGPEPQLSFRGQLQYVNISLAGLMYTPDPKYDGPDTLYVTVVDPLSNSASSKYPITINNASPTISPSPHGTVTAPINVSTAIPDITIGDTDIGSTNMAVTLSVKYGVLSVPGSSTVTGNGTSTVIINDTLTNVNIQLSGLRYTGFYVGTEVDTLTITANDQSFPTVGTDSEPVKITVIAAPVPPLSAPVITVPGGKIIPENSSAAITGISVYDGDIGTTGLLTVTLTVSHGTVTVQVPATTPGTTPVTYTNSIVTFTDTLTNVNTALAGLIYKPTDKYDSTDTLTITAEDQSPSPLSDTKTVAITVTNTDPTVTAPATATAVTATSTAITGISVADPDIAATNMSVTLSVGYGVLNLPSSTNVTGNGTSTVIITDSLATVNSQLSGLRYTSNSGFTGIDTLSITANDLSTPAAGTDSNQVAITVTTAPTPIASPPTINAPTVLSVNEDTTLPIQFGASNPISVQYADTTQELRVTLTANNGYITLGWKGHLNSYVGDGTLKVNFTGPLAAINEALYGLKYAPVHNYFDTTDDTMTIRVDDQAGQVTSQTMAINVYSVNDPPVVTVPGVQSVSVNTAKVISGVSVADPDIGAGMMKMTLGALHGALSVTGVGPTADITFTDTLANVNTLLGTLTYRPVSGYWGPDWITVTANDQGNSGAGGSMSDTKKVTVRVGVY